MRGLLVGDWRNKVKELFRARNSVLTAELGHHHKPPSGKATVSDRIADRSDANVEMRSDQRSSDRIANLYGGWVQGVDHTAIFSS